MPRSAIAGLDNSCVLFKKLPNYYPSWLYCFTFPSPVYPWSSFSVSVPAFIVTVSILGILISVQWYLMVVLLYIPLMANGIEHFFGYLFVICISSSLAAQTVKCLPTMQETQVQPLVGKIWRRKWQPTPGFLPGKSYGRRNLVGYSPWGLKELDTTEQFHFTFPHYMRIKAYPRQPHDWGLSVADTGDDIYFQLSFLSL